MDEFIVLNYTSKSVFGKVPDFDNDFVVEIPLSEIPIYILEKIYSENLKQLWVQLEENDEGKIKILKWSINYQKLQTLVDYFNVASHIVEIIEERLFINLDDDYVYEVKIKGSL